MVGQRINHSTRRMNGIMPEYTPLLLPRYPAYMPDIRCYCAGHEWVRMNRLTFR